MNEHDDALDPAMWDWRLDAEMMVLDGFPFSGSLDAAVAAALEAIRRALSRGVGEGYAVSVAMALLRFGEGAFDVSVAAALQDDERARVRQALARRGKSRMRP